MKRSLTTALRRIVSRYTRISNTATRESTSSGYIIIPPLARTSRMSIRLAGGTASTAAAADTNGAERKNPAAVKVWRFMNVTAQYRFPRSKQAPMPRRNTQGPDTREKSNRNRSTAEP